MTPQTLLLLDGGTGHLLKRQGLRITEWLSYDQQFLAGVCANAEQPDAVARVHTAYASAGADLLTTNSFAAAPRALRLLPHGVRARLWKRLVAEYGEDDKRDEASDLRLAAALAGEAASVAGRVATSEGRQQRVALSLPPLGECCYARPGSMPPPSREEAARQYLALARAMRRAVVSGGGGEGATGPPPMLLLAETLPTSDEALAALDAAVALAEEDEGEPSCEVWVSFTVRDEGGEASRPPRLRGGEELEAAVRRVLAHPAAAATASTQQPLLTAVLVNCCAPAAASAALPVLVRCCGAVGGSVRAGAYANGFRGTTSEWLLREAGDGAGLEEAVRWADNMHRLHEEDFEQEEGDDEESQRTITPGAYARYAGEWLRLGATVVGGCCGVGPRHVERLAAELREDKP